ncbi:hypothetical protein HHI36_004563 [Cryptolaemus montrouzieri]|uniref:Methyltransferase domain-containing protein n=1 Tax=Cryptolaemus montrouzieri TaxID=559131 RepID=A0ABD2NSK4_9CUCU
MNQIFRQVKLSAFYHDKALETYKNFLASVIIPKNASIMDIGCGSGRITSKFLHQMIPAHYKELVGIDIDHSNIEYCKTLKVDPRISFEQMDIDTKELPVKFRNRFDILFSSYCFMYARTRQWISNSYDLLKPNGELIYLFKYNINPLYSAYREMSRKAEWKPYINDFADFVPIYSGDNRNIELKNDFHKSGLILISHEFLPDIAFRTNKIEVLELLGAMNRVTYRIPADKKEKFIQAVQQTISDITNIDFMDKKKLHEEIQWKCPTVIIHAKKMI